MLGAQALRTKQKVEQKEREKRQKERDRKLQMQRERIQKGAHEDAQAMIEAATNQMQYLGLQPQAQAKNGIQVQRHYSMHAHAIQEQLNPMKMRDSPCRDPRVKDFIPHRSPSSDFGRNIYPPMEMQNGGGGGGNRLMKWLGFSSGPNKKAEKRRMSTY